MSQLLVVIRLKERWSRFLHVFHADASMSWTQGSGSRGGNWHRNQANNAANFFAQPSVNSHPNFRPTRIGTFSSLNEGASGKGPKPPDQPIMPYMRYSTRLSHVIK
ncbi:conserved hypothetical protein [Trichinella spiralis]|uniref:hypothetical protein n=1 Tax=Trichinella spiralis TaxID=6334 RepID=UPI0001EFD887|nr:conserved hypothetical protein [Trichinella spiralis]